MQGVAGAHLYAARDPGFRTGPRVLSRNFPPESPLFFTWRERAIERQNNTISHP